jgi:hypothetical protein
MQQSEDILVYVRWIDGYLEKFEAAEVRFGADLLWIRDQRGQNRHIPLQSVRWYSIYPESHERPVMAKSTDVCGAET